MLFRSQFGLYRSVALVRPQRRGRAGQRRYRQISSRIPFLGPSSLNSTMRWLSTMRKRSRGRSVEPGTRPLPSVDVRSADLRGGLASTMADSDQRHRKGRNHALRRPVHEGDPDNHRGIAGLELCRSAPCFRRSRPIHIVAILYRTNYGRLDVEAVSNGPCNSDKRCRQRTAINHCDPVRSAGKVPCCVQVARALK